MLARCTQVLDTNGVAVPMGADQREELEGTITQMASRGLRTLCLSFVDFPAEAPGRPADFFDQPTDENLTAMCIVGIKVTDVWPLPSVHVDVRD